MDVLLQRMTKGFLPGPRSVWLPRTDLLGSGSDAE
jgi:hypothetical protein